MRVSPNALSLLLTCGLLVFTQSMTLAAQTEQLPGPAAETPVPGQLNHLDYAMVRLPLACLLGAALALRPRRRGTPTRTPAVVQTQIILAIVGGVIMLVVGSSLARAFGIVGVASLIRYRAKIEDPKDAVVMLCALSVGLAAGVGLYALSIFSTAFLVAVLSVLESFAPQTVKHFELKIKPGEHATDLRARIESVLQRFASDYELRTAADDEVCYDVRVPLEMDTERITNDILKLDPKHPPAVEWEEKKVKAA